MNFDKIKRVPLCLFTAYFLKILVVSPTLVDGVVLLILGGAAAFYEAWSQLEIFEKMEAELAAMKLKHDELEKTQLELKTYVTGLKLGQQIRLGTNGR